MPSRNTPSDVVKSHLEAGETAIAWAELEDGAWLVMGRKALHVIDDVDQIHRRAWTDLINAAFDGETSQWTITPVDGQVEVLRLTTAAPATPRFAGAMSERLHNSIIHTLDTVLPGGGSARSTIRRSADGELFSQTVIADGATLAHPEDRRLIDDLEARARAAAGMEA